MSTEGKRRQASRSNIADWLVFACFSAEQGGLAISAPENLEPDGSRQLFEASSKLRDPAFLATSTGEGDLKTTCTQNFRSKIQRHYHANEHDRCRSRKQDFACFKTSDKDGNMGNLSRDVSPSQGLLQSAISQTRNRRLKKPLRGQNVST